MVALLMTDTEIRIIMWVVGGLLAALVSLLSFFVVRGINIQDKLTEAVQKLQVTLSGMNAIIVSIQDEKCEFKKYYETRHGELLGSIEGIEETLEDHGKRITRVETKLEV